MFVLALLLQGRAFCIFLSLNVWKIAAVILNPVLAVDSYPWFRLRAILSFRTFYTFFFLQKNFAAKWRFRRSGSQTVQGLQFNVAKSILNRF